MKKEFKVKKNLKQTLLFAGSVALTLGFLFLSSLVSKETRYQITETGAIVTEIEYKQLKKIGNKIEHNLTVVALFFALLAIPPAILGGLIVATRLSELEEEAAEYAKRKAIKQIQTDTDIATEQDICDINRNAAKTVHFKDVEKGFVELGREAKWLSEPQQKHDLEPASTPNIQIPANAQQQALTPSQEATGEAEKKTPKTPGEQLVADLAYSDKSMCVVGSTGAGKSHTLSVWLESVYSQARAKAQTASIWILARKKDSFCGLREAGKLTLFDSSNPEKAIKLIDDFHANLLLRMDKVEEADRPRLPPLRLILEDWSSIAAIFAENFDEAWSKIKVQLLDIITLGREFNVCILILAQSLILKALGLVGDSNIRANLAIVAQGLILKSEDGRTKGDYLLVEYAIKNPYFVSDKKQRQTYIVKLEELKLESRAKQIPIFYTTLGGGNMGLLPHIQKAFITLTPEERDEPITFNIEKFRQSLIRQEQGMAIQPMQTQVIERPQMTYDEIVASLNRLYKPDEDESDCSPDGELPSEPIEPTAEPLNQRRSEDSSESDSRFTTLDLNRAQALNLIKRLRGELNQTQIIERLWECKKGGSEAWKKAYAQFKELTKEEENENQ